MALTEAQQSLADTMSEISEFCWFASWLDGTEYRLWQFMADPHDDEVWGTYPIPPEYRERLERQGSAVGGWIYWRDGPDRTSGLEFMPRADWEVVYDAWWQKRRQEMELIKDNPGRYVDYADLFALHKQRGED